MSKIFVFLVMLCFSCSISLADTEKWDAAKEKRFKDYERKTNEKDDFEKRIATKRMKDIGNEGALTALATYEACLSPVTPEESADCKSAGYIYKHTAGKACQLLRENGHKPLPKTCDQFPEQKSDTNTLTRNPFEK